MHKINEASELPELISGSPEHKISLEGVKIRSAIAGLSQEVTMEQRFRNLEEVAIEAVYTFPLQNDAPVCRLEVLKNGSVLTGIVEERDLAINMYSKAIDAGNSGYFVESNRPDIFTVRVGNLGPGECVTIRIGYVTALKIIDESVRLSFPTTLSPRYVPPRSIRNMDDLLDAAKINPPQSTKVQYGLDFEISLGDGLPADTVDSPSHDIELDYSDPQVTKVRLLDDFTAMDRNVVVNLALQKQTVPQAIFSEGPGGAHYVSFTLFPELDWEDHEHLPTETCLILDSSGSMSGHKYKQAVEALGLCLRSLGSGDSFNIIRFGSSFEIWKNVPVPYSEDSLKEALDYLDKSEADLGGTELIKPLKHLFSQEVCTGKSRDVILLTDGQVSNEDTVHDIASMHADCNRIFTFGIGSSCSMHLVKGIADATQGASEFIQSGESIQEKVLRTFGRMASPRVENLKVTFDGINSEEVTLADPVLPAVFEGDAFLMHARVERPRIPKSVQLSGTIKSRKVSWKAPVWKANGRCAEVPALAWAKMRIDKMTKEIDRIGSNPDVPYPRQMIEVLDISKTYGVLSKYTSMVAIEHRSREDLLHGKPELRRIPVTCLHQEPSKPQNTNFIQGVVTDYQKSLNLDLEEYCIDFDAPVVKKCSLPPIDEEDLGICRSDLMMILECQQADGSILYDKHEILFWSFEGRKAEKFLRTNIPQIDRTQIRPLAATFHTLAILEISYGDKKDVWKRQYRKALSYLELNLKNEDITSLISMYISTLDEPPEGEIIEDPF